MRRSAVGGLIPMTPIDSYKTAGRNLAIGSVAGVAVWFTASRWGQLSKTASGAFAIIPVALATLASTRNFRRNSVELEQEINDAILTLQEPLRNQAFSALAELKQKERLDLLGMFNQCLKTQQRLDTQMATLQRCTIKVGGGHDFSMPFDPNWSIDQWKLQIYRTLGNVAESADEAGVSQCTLKLSGMFVYGWTTVAYSGVSSASVLDWTSSYDNSRPWCYEPIRRALSEN